ncbi:histone-lysine N-methyltransferase SETD1B-A isoform X2 [Drosophila takahashii]
MSLASTAIDLIHTGLPLLEQSAADLESLPEKQDAEAKQEPKAMEEAVLETIAEPPTDLAADVTADSPLEPPSEPLAEPLPEPLPKTLQEPLLKCLIEPLPQPVQEPLPKPLQESLPQPLPEPLVKPVPEPLPENTTEPLQEPLAEKQPQPIPEPLSNPLPKALPEPLPEPPLPEPLPEPLPKPLPEPLPEPQEGRPETPAGNPENQAQAESPPSIMDISISAQMSPDAPVFYPMGSCLARLLTNGGGGGGDSGQDSPSVPRISPPRSAFEYGTGPYIGPGGDIPRSYQFIDPTATGERNFNSFGLGMDDQEMDEQQQAAQLAETPGVSWVPYYFGSPRTRTTGEDPLSPETGAARSRNNSRSHCECRGEASEVGTSTEFPSFESFAGQLDEIGLARDEFMATLRNLLIRANDLLAPLLQGPFQHMTPIQMAEYTSAILETPPLHPSLFMPANVPRPWTGLTGLSLPYDIHPHSLTPEDLARIQALPKPVDAATQTEFRCMCMLLSQAGSAPASGDLRPPTTSYFPGQAMNGPRMRVPPQPYANPGTSQNGQAQPQPQQPYGFWGRPMPMAMHPHQVPQHRMPRQAAFQHPPPPQRHPHPQAHPQPHPRPGMQPGHPMAHHKMGGAVRYPEAGNYRGYRLPGPYSPRNQASRYGAIGSDRPAENNGNINGRNHYQNSGYRGNPLYARTALGNNQQQMASVAPNIGHLGNPIGNPVQPMDLGMQLRLNLSAEEANASRQVASDSSRTESSATENTSYHSERRVSEESSYVEAEDEDGDSEEVDSEGEEDEVEGGEDEDDDDEEEEDENENDEEEDEDEDEEDDEQPRQLSAPDSRSYCFGEVEFMNYVMSETPMLPNPGQQPGAAAYMEHGLPPTPRSNVPCAQVTPHHLPTHFPGYRAAREQPSQVMPPMNQMPPMAQMSQMPQMSQVPPMTSMPGGSYPPTGIPDGQFKEPPPGSQDHYYNNQQYNAMYGQPRPNFDYNASMMGQESAPVAGPSMYMRPPPPPTAAPPPQGPPPSYPMRQERPMAPILFEVGGNRSHSTGSPMMMQNVMSAHGHGRGRGRGPSRGPSRGPHGHHNAYGQMNQMNQNHGMPFNGQMNQMGQMPPHMRNHQVNHQVNHMGQPMGRGMGMGLMPLPVQMLNPNRMAQPNVQQGMPMNRSTMSPRQYANHNPNAMPSYQPQPEMNKMPPMAEGGAAAGSSTPRVNFAANVANKPRGGTPRNQVGTPRPGAPVPAPVEVATGQQKPIQPSYASMLQ